MKVTECNNETVNNGKNDLKTKPNVIVYPLPDYAECHCCGRHISELTPFDGKFEGSLLIRRYRREAPYSEEAEKAVDEAEEHCCNGGRPMDWMIAKYGKKKGEILYMMGQGSSTVGSSWECRDCIFLAEADYFEKLYSRLSTKEG